ncbi:hypothetical protein RB595_007710 [Gaeumannomyces hyphopodioides]
MAPAKRNSKVRLGSATGSKGKSDGSPPKPYRTIPDSLKPFVSGLDPKHVYIAHLDSKPVALKRKIFLVPLAMNILVAVLFFMRLRYIGPWYMQLLLPGIDLTPLLGAEVAQALGLGGAVHVADPTIGAAPSSMTWGQIALLALRRGFTFVLDAGLLVFVWPWPVEFCLGRTHGNPVNWRWRVGFRDKEVYVRRSREWDRALSDILDPGSATARMELSVKVRAATAPLLLDEKTGYLTMNGDWDLDWAAMILATRLVDNNALALDAFRLLVLVHHADHGWMIMDTGSGSGGASSSHEDERRRQVFAFRDALSAIGKEDLFFRWIEIVQFEATQPGGLTKDKEVAVASQIREMFQAQGIDFDDFWKQSVGSEGIAGME